MAETYTFRRARLTAKNVLTIVWDAGSARSGVPTVDPSKFDITASGGAVGTTATTGMQLLSYAGLASSSLLAAFLPPAYTSIDDGVSNHLIQRILLDRTIEGDETVTIDLTAGFNSDDTNTSEALTDQAVEVLTFCDSNGEIQPTYLQRTGSGGRASVEPDTLSPVLRIKASDLSGVGDGGTAGATFTASTGGTITVTGTVTYYDDIVSSLSLNGSAGCAGLLIDSAAKLTSTVAMGSSTQNFTVIAVYACESSSSSFNTNGAHCSFAWQGGTRRRIKPTKAGANFDDGGRYSSTASNPTKRVYIGGGTYDHNGGAGRIQRIGAGGMTYWDEAETTAQDHTDVIELDPTSSGDVYLTELLVYDSKLTQRQIYELCSTLEEDHSLQNRIIYIDPTSGDDTNSGLTTAAPQKSIPFGGGFDHFPYGAGDVALFKYGEEYANDAFYTGTAAGDASFAFSSRYPCVIGAYGTRSDGRFKLAGRAASDAYVQNETGNPYALIFGIDVDYERRNPQHATEWDGFTTTETESSIVGFEMDYQPSNADEYFDGDDDPAFHAVIDCAAQHVVKGITDDTGACDEERWFVSQGNLFHHTWYGRSSSDTGVRAVGVFMASSSIYTQTENVFSLCGWSPYVASIGDWASGAQTFTAEAVATYAAGTDDTTITLTGAFANFLYGGTTVGPLLVTLKRTSDATEYTVQIKSKTSDNEIVVEGNPFSLADTASVSDCLCHGGSPAAEAGVNHGAYISNTEMRAGTLNMENLYLRCADHGFQQRGGGWAVNNIMVDCAIGGYVSGDSVSVLQGNTVIGGKRTRSISSLSGPRAWGVSAATSSSTPYLIEVRNNLILIDPFGEYSSYEDTVSGTSYAIDVYKNDAAQVVNVIANTVYGYGGKGIKKSGTTAYDSDDTVEFNIIVQPSTDVDAVTGTVLVDIDMELADWNYNIYYHPGGSSESRFDDTNQTFSGWQTLSSSTGEQFKLPTFENAGADIAEYYGTLGGGSDDQAAYITAVLAANNNGDMSELTAAESLNWLRLQYQPTDLTAASDGDGTDAPGAVLLMEDVPTISNVTPADNSSGVLDTQTLSIQFSETIAYNTGSALIEVYQGGMQVASAAVNSGTINVSDKTQYSITGLLSGLLGAVSVRISASAFKSLVTGLPFDGITDDTTWNFTIGNLSGNRSRNRDGTRSR